jgi:flavin-dependent dehydrogenase
VALIEQDHYQSPRVGETMPPVIRRQLTGLGVWERFRETGPLESYGIQTAWDTANSRTREYLRNPYGCGWHVDRARFDAMLASSAADAGAALIRGRVSSCTKDAHGQWRLETTSDPATLTGRMLVDATGRKALLASRLGAQAQVTDRLIGAVSFAPSLETVQWTVLEAVENGWWYSAPLPGACMVYTYMTDADLWQEAEWERLFHDAPLIARRAATGTPPPPVEVVSAASLVRTPVTRSDWIAIGDAALSCDPLCGQGVYQSIETALRAAAAIADYFAGDANGLSDYENWIQQTYATYLATRASIYRSVRRWPQSEFWKRRAGG